MSPMMTIQDPPNVMSRWPVGKGRGGYVSVKQYAQHAGITPAAAYKRLHAGQLGDGVIHHQGRYWIDPQRADAAWAHHGKPCNSRSAQLEQRLMAVAEPLAAELAGMPIDYCRVAIYRVMGELLD